MRLANLPKLISAWRGAALAQFADSKHLSRSVAKPTIILVVNFSFFFHRFSLRCANACSSQAIDSN